MKFSIVKEILLEALNDFSKIYESKTTNPIISHIYIKASNEQLLLVATDTQVTLEANIPANIEVEGEITVPGAKFYDAIRYLPNGMFIQCASKHNQFSIDAGNSHYALTTLPADDFPFPEKDNYSANITISSHDLHTILQKIKFSMATDDPRHFFHGVYLHLISEGQQLNAVATDGHRLSCAHVNVSSVCHDLNGVILPKKAVQELIKLTARFEQPLILNFNQHQMNIILDKYQFTTNLIDGIFPSYEAVIPEHTDEPVIIARDALLQALQRGKVLLVDKQDGIRLTFEQNQLELSARNQENETVKEHIDISNNRQRPSCETALNINYFIEAVSNLDGDNIQMYFEDGDSPFLITSKDDDNIKYVIMPMRL